MDRRIVKTHRKGRRKVGGREVYIGVIIVFNNGSSLSLLQSTTRTLVHDVVSEFALDLLAAP